MQNEQLALSSPVNKSVDNSQKADDYLDYYALLCNTFKIDDLGQNIPKFEPVDNFPGETAQQGANPGKKAYNLAGLIAKYLISAGHGKAASRILNCGQKWLPFECSASHVIYRQVTCGLPYCPKCSQSGAWYSKKRLKTVRDTLLGFPMLGHYVFTLPKEISQGMPSSKQNTECYKLAWRILGEFFDAEAAVIILHFCGDKKAGLHIHFDCSFPILYRNGDCDYPLAILRLARAEWTSGINKIFKQNFGDTVGHYNFVATLPQQQHLIKYITRSTIEAEKFIELPELQKEYCLKMSKGKTIRYFGKFVGKQKEEFLKKFKCSEVLKRPKGESNIGDLISQNICPICLEKMKPQPLVYLDDVPLMNVTRYNGYTLMDRQFAALLHIEEKPALPVYDSLLECLIAEFKEGGINGEGLRV